MSHERRRQKVADLTVNATTSGTAGGTTAAGGSKKAAKELDKDAFLKLLVTQLKYQDPMKPLEDKEFIVQMAQFSSVEQLQNLSVGMDRFVQLQTRASLMSEATGFMGRTVTVNDAATGKSVTGKVSGVKVVEGVPKIVVNAGEYDVGSVQEVVA